ncbi:AAA family ATPase [Psychrobacter sp. Sarcosine-02u-2]|uniref:AAA family ATPase n=1 Tax=Psychrobacter sp. Sarcosine-02u-2 TaxID=2058324 RepID=UPI000C79701E|nr:AAA family ATPase [Psychrobacter sp. Sarcosine-02u-2]PKG83078.1 AAA family ATPase [Psychrobacter sp. Sarcosine-02u-2]
MMKLKKVELLKYKSYTEKQNFEVAEDITILVGMNESGKTAALEAIAKTNYFQDDDDFKFNVTHDYPRREKKKMEKSDEEPVAIVCTYKLDETLIAAIENELGKDALKSTLIDCISKYTSNRTWSNVGIDRDKFVKFQTSKLGISSKSLNDKLVKINSSEELNDLIESYNEDQYKEGISSLAKFYTNEWKWESDPLSEYVARVFIKPNLPKFLYYDEYFALPSRISIEKLENKTLGDSEQKTARALFDLADIDTSELIQSNDFEDFIAELEATEAIISEELFKYWQTNKNLGITFQIDSVKDGSNRVIEHVLDIRVKNKGVSLPLKNRSKGFNWFFSFLVWFKKIQEDSDSQYILLLDEPGLNLHASAQADLLRFLEDLSEDYQIIYTTHSPFMIPSNSLERVRTVFEEDKTSVISNSIQEKDPNTLFPLQAALGYDIAQNLFVSNKNLLVEGVSDLIILTALSGLLESLGRQGIREDITIVPTGGLEKVATFISLLRGSQLEIVCLLDSYNDVKAKAKMENLISERIIHQSKVRFFHEFLETHDKADLEDLFNKKDYLNLFNLAFNEYNDIEISDLNPNISRIILQINKVIEKGRFNHFRPANEIAKISMDGSSFDEITLHNFEKVFKEINSLFE